MGPIPSTRSLSWQRGRHRDPQVDEKEQVDEVSETSTAPTLPAGEAKDGGVSMNEKQSEPSIVDCGFQANRWGGWWYREPQNRYTIQIVPTNTIHESRDWRLGIARPDGRGMIWGKIDFPAPEAAALHACRVVKDEGLRDKIAQAMTLNQQLRENGIKRALDNFMEKRYGS